MKLLKKCDQIHQFCEDSFPCPWCANAMPLRYEDGRFASHIQMTDKRVRETYEPAEIDEIMRERFG